VDNTVLLAFFGGLALAGLVVFVLLKRSSSSEGGQMATLMTQLQEQNSQLAGRLSQMAEDGRKSQAELAKTLADRLDVTNQKMGQSLEASSAKTAKSMGEIQTRLSVIDEAQKNITALSTDIVGLQDILSNKQARGAFGEVQLNDLVSNILPPNAYSFQETLSNGKRADCLLKMPNPPGSIVVDAKFPLESYHNLMNAKDDVSKVAAERQFRDDMVKHVKDIAEKYIIPGETAESALMFLPSEAVYAELHANFPAVVEKSFAAKVWIVSPTTLMATLNTVRAILKDVKMREQASVIQTEVGHLVKDTYRLDERVQNLSKHFRLAEKDIGEIQTSAGKIIKRSDKITSLELEDDPAGDKIVQKPDNKGLLGVD
jgi:DNA recombination protein RmuC